MNVLYESKLIIEQTNNVARDYQKRVTKLQRKINIMKLQSLTKDLKNENDYAQSLKSRINLI